MPGNIKPIELDGPNQYMVHRGGYLCGVPGVTLEIGFQQKLSAESFENWIARTRYAGIDGKTMLATAPDRQTTVFLVEEYGQLINALAVARSGPSPPSR